MSIESKKLEKRIGLLAAVMKKRPLAPSEWWVAREDYEKLRKEQPHLPEVEGDGSIVHVKGAKAYGEE
jgi:hypothetical protein